MQTFSPSEENTTHEGYVPLEILLDLRCENSAFDRLVPQTDAILQYDKFNRLRLRNNITSVARVRRNSDEPLHHLQNQIVRILFSDVAHDLIVFSRISSECMCHG